MVKIRERRCTNLLSFLRLVQIYKMGSSPVYRSFNKKDIRKDILFVEEASEEPLTRGAGSRLRCRSGRRKTEVPRTSCDRLSLFRKTRKVKALRDFYCRRVSQLYLQQKGAVKNNDLYTFTA